MTTAATTKARLEYVETGSRRNPWLIGSQLIGSQPGPTSSAHADDSDGMTAPTGPG